MFMIKEPFLLDKKASFFNALALIKACDIIDR